MQKLNSYFKKFDKEDVKYIKKYLPLREREEIANDIIIFEPLIRDILDWQNGILTEMEFLSRCINVADIEVAMLPLSVYKKAIKTLFKFITDEEENKQKDEDNESIKKN